MNILIINPGSTTIKYKLYQGETGELIEVLSGMMENKKGVFTAELKKDGEKHEWEISEDDFNNAPKLILKEITDYPLDKIGFRVVHGGELFQDTTILNAEIIDKLSEFNDLAPLHNPPALKIINKTLEITPQIPMYAVFDTAFHKTLPDYAYLYPIPQHYYKEFKIRRYGFHGSSHAYVSSILSKIEPDAHKVITCHLGGGASLAAIVDGKCIDTSMGFTPSEGLMMATRAGDLDDGIGQYLMKYEHYTVDDMINITNKFSGLLGVSDLTSDMRVLLEQESTNNNARLAIDMYIYRIQKYIGSYAAAMNGLDALVFTAGVGAGSSEIRRRICEQLNYLNITIGEENSGRENVSENLKISSDRSTPVWVIPTNEELYIAQQVAVV